MCFNNSLQITDFLSFVEPLTDPSCQAKEHSREHGEHCGTGPEEAGGHSQRHHLKSIQHKSPPGSEGSLAPYQTPNIIIRLSAYKSANVHTEELASHSWLLLWKVAWFTLSRCSLSEFLFTGCLARQVKDNLATCVCGTVRNRQRLLSAINHYAQHAFRDLVDAL